MKFGPFEFKRHRPEKVDAEVIVRPARQVLAADPMTAGDPLKSGGTAIHTLVQRLSTEEIDQRTALEMRHIIRKYIPDVQTALIGRRAVEGELCIKSDDEVLQQELRDWADSVLVGYLETGCPTGLNLWIDGLGDGADEYGLALGEPVFKGRQIERLTLPDMRSFEIERKEGRHRIIQKRGGKREEVSSGTVHSLAFKPATSDLWPPALIWGAEFVSEALLRMYTSLNTIWLQSGTPPMMYGIEYDKDARVQTTTATDGAGNAQKVDVNLEALAAAIQTVKQARRRGMTAEIVMSVVGGKVIANPIFGNPTTAGLVKEVEPHFRVFSGSISQLAELPSWLFASGAQRTEGIGSNRANQEAAIAFAAAERRRPKMEFIARNILNTFLLTQRATSSINNFTLEWTAPSIINENLIQEARERRANADATFVRTSFEMFNPEGLDDLTDEQREYLEENDVFIPTPPVASD